jgi:hypothetical protein
MKEVDENGMERMIRGNEGGIHGREGGMKEEGI